MAGYKGYSMSNNAVQAYEQGERPYSRWTKAAILEEIENMIETGELPESVADSMKGIKKDHLLSFLERSSWHHTSAKYNRTDFYSVSPEKVIAYAERQEAKKKTVSARCMVHIGWNEKHDSIYEERVLSGYVNKDIFYPTEGGMYLPHEYKVIQ